MAAQKVGLDSLVQNGLEVVQEMFNQELARVVRDLTGRPGDKSVRSVLLQWNFKPSVDQNGICTEAKGYVTCVSKIPKQKTRTMSFGLSAGGALIFNGTSPEDVNQMTFDNETGEED